MTVEFWTNVIENEPFYGDSPLRTEAARKLLALDKDLPLKLVERICDTYLAKSSHTLWPAIKKMKPAHLEPLVRALKRSKEIPAQLLSAAHEQEGVEGLERALGLVLHVKLSTNVPGMLKSVAKRWDKLQAEKIRDPAAVVLERAARSASREEAGDAVLRAALLFLVARVDPGHAAVEKTRLAYERWGDEHGVFARVLKAAKTG